jgi:hypothetical protein
VAEPPDPLISVVVNLSVAEDIGRIARICELNWARYRFEIRADE